jgi:murein DD-endopeptidase MepM/ murein hydrolase activator NlpD
MRIELANVEITHSGYDEYRYNIDGIAHDPFALIAFLTAVYGEFTYEAAEPVLRDIFAEQYTLDFTPIAETRYYYDDEGSAVPYEWNILTVTLTSVPFTEVIFARMTEEQRQQYDILMMSKGMRQYAGSPFGFNWLLNISSYYGCRVHPITGAKDYHKGIDIALPEGTEILSAFDGTVVTVAYDASYGNYVVIENSDGVQAKYAHCYSIDVTEGQSVTKGGVIAAVGTTGSSTGNHLHMEIVKEGRHINPLFYTEFY